jgi:hypothetical protein
MKRFRMALAATIVLVGLGACGDHPSAPQVPSLSASGGTGTGTHAENHDNPNAVGGDSSAARRARLHAAAQCIRDHGAPDYQDPLLTADGYVYTDEVALRSLDGPALDAVTTACQTQIHAANFSVRDQGPPPPKLIQAGVKANQCLRSHGLPKMTDPTVDSPFSPGKGFGLQLDAIPPGGKQNPIVQRALAACRSVLDQEAQLSSLGNLGNA